MQYRFSFSFKEWLENLFNEESPSGAARGGYYLIAREKDNPKNVVVARPYLNSNDKPPYPKSTVYTVDIDTKGSGPSMTGDVFLKRYEIMANPANSSIPHEFVIGPMAFYAKNDSIKAAKDFRAGKINLVPVGTKAAIDAIAASTPSQAPAASGSTPTASGGKRTENKEISDKCQKVFSSGEKKGVDEKFRKIWESGQKGHVVINALAGSGKTTVLQCLWDKYGKNSGTSWCYLVFNRRNRMEAYSKFEGLKNIFTTNSFLGQQLRKNTHIVKDTSRSIDFGGADYKLKSALDSPAFKKFFESVNDVTTEKFVAKLKAAGVRNTWNRNSPIDCKNNNYLTGIFVSYVGKLEDAVAACAEKLTALGKNFGVNPNDEAALNARVDDIVARYDLTQDLESVIEDFAEDGRSVQGSEKECWDYLKDLLQDTPLEEKIESIKELAKWLLLHTSPGHDVLSKETEFINQANRKKAEKLEQELRSGKISQNEFDRKMRPLQVVVPFHNVRDFDDDYYYSGINIDKIKFDHYDVVMADEIQDFNYVQKLMLKKLAEAGAIIVAVGDPNQAIYRFRGAENTSFNDIVDVLQADSKATTGSDESVVAEMPSNFRSRKAIIDYVNANTVVNNLRVGKDFSNDRPEFEGIVRDNVDPKDMIDIIKADPNKSTALLTRTNAPLASAAIELLSNGIPFTIIGRDYANEVIGFFNKIIKKMNISMNADLRRMVGNPVTGETGDLDHWFQDELSQHGRKATKKEYLKETSSMVSMFKNVAKVAMSQDTNVTDLRGLMQWIRNFFFKNSVGEDGTYSENGEEKQLEIKDNDDRVILTTAHRSKGFEFKRVFILDISKFPSPKARLPEDMAQEENAKYVAFTRAEEELYILDDKKAPV